MRNNNIQAWANFDGDEVCIIETYAPAYRGYRVSYLIVHPADGLRWVTEDRLTDIRWLVAA